MATYPGTSGPDNLYGSGTSDTLTGDDGNDNLYGGDGTDLLYGGGGNDQLDGGAGNDIMYGGLGNDTYVVRESGDLVIELVGEGVDTVKSFVTYSLGANFEVLSLQGADNVSGAGNELNNTIAGNVGNNFLAGRGGNDNINGGEGNDTIEGGAGDDVLYGGLGIDTLSYDDAISGVVVSLSIITKQNTSGSGKDAASGFENLTGSDFNDTLTGDSGDNRIVGGLGADSMIGGAGGDTYTVDDAGDTVSELIGDSGVDLVVSSVSFTLTGGAENLSLVGSAAINGTGNSLDNKISGNVSGNVLNGKGGHDDISGGKGADTFVFDAADDASSDAIRGFDTGVDTIQVSGAGFGLVGGAIAVDQLVLGAVATEAFGQFLLNGLSQLYWDADGTGGGAAVLVADFFGASVAFTDIFVGP